MSGTRLKMRARKIDSDDSIFRVGKPERLVVFGLHMGC